MLIRNSLVRRTFTMRRFRAITRDKAASQVLTQEQLGPKRARTPEGFLLCQDVPVARIGEMLYGAGEVPLEPGPDGVIRVTRDERALFSDIALASYVGKPVVDDHPEEDVTPENWKQLSIGVVLNPRRGTGDDSDVMLADLLVTDASAIRDIEAGKREVSAGYEADYEQTGPGEGRQTNIIGNHVALVERGRCGARCAIGDHQPKELKSMSLKTKPKRASFADRIRQIFADAGEELVNSMPEADDEGSTHIHIHANGASAEGAPPAGGDEPLPGDDPTLNGGAAPTKDDPIEMRFQSLEAGHKALGDKLDQIMAKLGGTSDEDPAAQGQMPDDITAKDGLPEELEEANKAKTGDSIALQTSFQAVLADAEVLVPGFRMPTFDSKAKRKQTLDAMCSLRRSVLSHLASTAEGAQLMGSVGGKLDIQGATCVDVATTFRAAAGAKRLLNNGANTRDAGRMPQPAGPAVRAPVTLAQLNKLNAEYHAKRP